GRGIVGDRIGVVADLEIDEAATVESVEVAGPNFQGPVAIPHRRLQLAEDGARPAAVVERLGILRIEPDDFVEVLDRTPKVSVLRIELTALVISGAIVGIGPY